MSVVSDASYNNTLKCRALCGYIICLNGTPVSWAAGMTATTIGSTCGAEAYGLSMAVKEALMLRGLLLEIGCDVAPFEIATDNNGTLIVMLGANKRATAWWNWRICHARQVIDAGLATIKFLPTKANVADIMTKPMRTALQFNYLLDWLYESG